MVIVYESKTGFTKKYAYMLAEKTGLKVFGVKELPKVDPQEEIIFLGWLKAGKIQGISKLKNYNVKAVCATGTGRAEDNDAEAIIRRNKINGIPYFYLQGGCLPLKELRGMDKIMMSMFLKMLKSRKDKDEKIKESISHIENGFDGVKEKNLRPVLEWINRSN